MGPEYIKQLPNGLTLLGEYNEAVSSAAIEWRCWSAAGVLTVELMC